MESIVYEGYGGRAAVMVECLTDNRKRTVSDVRRYVPPKPAAIWEPMKLRRLSVCRKDYHFLCEGSG